VALRGDDEVGRADDDVLEASEYYRLAEDADRSRWRLSDVPWDSFDAARATPDLVGFVQRITFSELTTFSATRKFMHEFGDDVDFSQWLSVWFFEETRHPHVLLRWLQRAGHREPSSFIAKGRVTAPFMKSRTGTLVTNVISEMVATAWYVHLSRNSLEPTLAWIARMIASDEARHANGFFHYAQRAIASSADPDGDRRTALKVLQLWLENREQVGHPVNLLYRRYESDSRGGGEPTPVGTIDYEKLNVRVCRTIGALAEVDIRDSSDVMAALRRGQAARSDPPGDSTTR